MLNLREVYTIPLPTRNDYICLTYHTRYGRREAIYMLGISPEEEAKIDKKESFNIKTKTKEFVIRPEYIIGYGEIDFNTNSDDFDSLDNFNFFDVTSFKGICIPANYDYKTHTCTSDRNFVKWYDTTSSALILQYKHGVINKPKRTLIFKQIL